MFFKLSLIISQLLYNILDSTHAVQMQDVESLPRLEVYIVDKRPDISLQFNCCISLVPDYSGIFAFPCLLSNILCMSQVIHVHSFMIVSTFQQCKYSVYIITPSILSYGTNYHCCILLVLYSASSKIKVLTVSTQYSHKAC